MQSVKKMTTEHLQLQVEEFNRQSVTERPGQAEIDWFTACKAELSRRWGIKL